MWVEARAHGQEDQWGLLGECSRTPTDRRTRSATTLVNDYRFLKNGIDETSIKNTSTPIGKEPAMRTSEARIKANKINSAKSKGPTTIEGKEKSRRNGLKHGMTGQGIVVPHADEDEVKRRHEALTAELSPISVMGAILVGQMATLSVRMERGAAQEFATVAERVRHAAEEFDVARVEKAEQLLKSISDDPRGNLRKLLRLPKGVDVLVDAWDDLRADLTRDPRPLWTPAHLATMANLLGLRDVDVSGSRIQILTSATWGDPFTLADCDGASLDRDARKSWARDQLVERIDEEIAKLEAHFQTLDLETIEQDRAEAGARASFDPSKEATLARRYESEARRGFFRSLKEFHKAETEAVERAESAPPAFAIPPDSQLASSCGGASPDPDVSDEAPLVRTQEASRPVSMGALREAEVVREENGRLSRTGRPVPAAA
jgi:hypothetical protein